MHISLTDNSLNLSQRLRNNTLKQSSLSKMHNRSKAQCSSSSELPILWSTNGKRDNGYHPYTVFFNLIIFKSHPSSKAGILERLTMVIHIVVHSGSRTQQGQQAQHKMVWCDQHHWPEPRSSQTVSQPQMTQFLD